jgi:hypothetical protein
MGLWDRVNEKRKQRKTDSKQDVELKALREQVEQQKQGKGRDDQLQRRDELGDSFEQSGMMIQRQYDQGYNSLGRRFAMGDSESASRNPGRISVY